MSEPTQALPAPRVRAVSNTGPLIFAFQCGRVDLLEQFYEVLYIATAQMPEFEKHGAADETKALIDQGFVLVVELTDEEKQQADAIAQRIAASPLTKDKDAEAHVPEAQAMVLMQRVELGASVILLEELAAREVARELGLDVFGFVGVLADAAQRRLITPEEVRQALEICRQKGTHYSGKLVESAVRRARGE